MLPASAKRPLKITINLGGSALPMDRRLIIGIAPAIETRGAAIDHLHRFDLAIGADPPHGTLPGVHAVPITAFSSRCCNAKPMRPYGV